MMPFSINIVAVFGTVAVFALGILVGFLFRLSQSKKAKKRIFELETEMISTHAEILRLQELQADLEVPDNGKVPVVSLLKPMNRTVRKHSS